MGAVACGAENNLRKTCLIPGTVVGAVILDKGLYAPKYMYLFVLLFFFCTACGIWARARRVSTLPHTRGIFSAPLWSSESYFLPRA